MRSEGKTRTLWNHPSAKPNPCEQALFKVHFCSFAGHPWTWGYSSHHAAPARQVESYSKRGVQGRPENQEERVGNCGPEIQDLVHERLFFKAYFERGFSERLLKSLDLRSTEDELRHSKNSNEQRFQIWRLFIHLIWLKIITVIVVIILVELVVIIVMNYQKKSQYQY